jgi:hypothetical protein
MRTGPEFENDRFLLHEPEKVYTECRLWAVRALHVIGLRSRGREVLPDWTVHSDQSEVRFLVKGNI